MALYGIWAALVARFLRTCGAGLAVSFVASLACMLTMPVAAFPYQYYPEIGAGLFVTLVSAHILTSGVEHRPTRRTSFVVGLPTD